MMPVIDPRRQKHQYPHDPSNQKPRIRFPHQKAVTLSHTEDDRPTFDQTRNATSIDGATNGTRFASNGKWGDANTKTMSVIVHMVKSTCEAENPRTMTTWGGQITRSTIKIDPGTDGSIITLVEIGSITITTIITIIIIRLPQFRTTGITSRISTTNTKGRTKPLLNDVRFLENERNRWRNRNRSNRNR